MSRTLFQPGKLVFTPGAGEAFTRNRELPSIFLSRHLKGDWGDVSKKDAEENELSLRKGHRILSAYKLQDRTRIWFITEADRSSTTILLPDEYSNHLG